MKRTIVVVLAALLLLSAPIRAQNPLLDTGSITAVSSGGACSAAPAGCAVFALGNAAIVSVTLQVSGTFTGTLLFEATSDGTNWFTISGTKLADGSSSTGFASISGTNTGQFSFSNSGLLSIRARATAWTSGTASIAAVRGYAIARWLTPFLSTITVDGIGIVGNGTAPATINGTLTTSTTSTCTAADLLETDLWTYTLPANALNANGRGVRITAWLITAANANTKTGKLYVGGTQITGGATAVSGAAVRLTAEVLRTGASAEIYDSATISGNFASGTAQAGGTLAVDTTASMIIKVTGQNGTAAANDICVKGAIVETLK